MTDSDMIKMMWSALTAKGFITSEKEFSDAIEDIVFEARMESFNEGRENY